MTSNYIENLKELPNILQNKVMYLIRLQDIRSVYASADQ